MWLSADMEFSNFRTKDTVVLLWYSGLLASLKMEICIGYFSSDGRLYWFMHLHGALEWLNLQAVYSGHVFQLYTLHAPDKPDLLQL